MTHSRDMTRPEAQAAGQLLAVLGERDSGALVRAVSRLARTGASQQGNVGYNRILTWVVSTVAEIIVEPVGWPTPKPTDSQVTFRTLGGDAVDFTEAPTAVQCVGRAVEAKLADDDDTVRAALEEADHADASTRADILLEAIALLDRLLDVRLRHVTEE